MDKIRFAIDVPVGISGRRSKFATFLADAAIHVVLRERAVESLKRKLDFRTVGICLHLGNLSASWEFPTKRSR